MVGKIGKGLGPAAAVVWDGCKSVIIKTFNPISYVNFTTLRALYNHFTTLFAMFAGLFDTYSKRKTAIQSFFKLYRGFILADREGFEPSRPLWGLHDFQSCALDQLSHLSTSASCKALVYNTAFCVKCQCFFQKNLKNYKKAVRPSKNRTASQQTYAS